MSLILQKIFHLGPSSSASYQREHDEWKKWLSSHPSLTTHLKLTNTYLWFAPTSVPWPKITDRVTLHTVINGAVWPLIQINIPEGFLNPVEDRWPKMTEEERWEKVQKMILPIANTPCLAHKPRNIPTHVLAVAVWLKLNHKYFNEGMAKEVCDWFEVRAKQLSRILPGRKYLGGMQSKKRKATETATTAQEPPTRRKKAN